MKRNEELVSEEIYHIFSKSIADFHIFNTPNQFDRVKKLFQYYQYADLELRYSKFIESKTVGRDGFSRALVSAVKDKKRIAQIIAYCIMPTHVHLILKQLVDYGVSRFMHDVMDSYSKYFNKVCHRKGPLWEGRFRNVLVDNDEQLMHLTRYIHLNPATARIVENPEEWPNSSYAEYLLSVDEEDKVCEYDGIFCITPGSYKNFVNDRIAYQRELYKIKKHLLD